MPPEQDAPDPANHEEWLLDKELDVVAEVYAAEAGLRKPLSALSEEELLERYFKEAGFVLQFDFKTEPPADATEADEPPR